MWLPTKYVRHERGQSIIFGRERGKNGCQPRLLYPDWPEADSARRAMLSSCGHSKFSSICLMDIRNRMPLNILIYHWCTLLLGLGKLLWKTSFRWFGPLNGSKKERKYRGAGAKKIIESYSLTILLGLINAQSFPFLTKNRLFGSFIAHFAWKIIIEKCPSKKAWQNSHVNLNTRMKMDTYTDMDNFK